MVAIVCNTLLLRFSRSLGIRNKNDVVIRWSNESKPSLGGVSFFVVFVFAAIAYSIVFHEAPNIFQNKQYVGLFVAGSLAFLVPVLANTMRSTLWRSPAFKMCRLPSTLISASRTGSRVLTETLVCAA